MPILVHYDGRPTVIKTAMERYEDRMGQEPEEEFISVCHICHKDILDADMDTRHWHHEEWCNYGTAEWNGCKCDLEAHADCCTGCRSAYEDDGQSLEMRIAELEAENAALHNDLYEARQINDTNNAVVATLLATIESAVVVELRAEIERLSREVDDAEKAKGFCYSCNKEIAKMAQLACICDADHLRTDDIGDVVTLEDSTL